MPSGENGCGMGETNSSRQPSFESDLHAVDGGQRRFLRLTLSDSWIGVRVVYGTGLENQRCIRVRGFESYPIRHQQSDTLCTRLLFTYLRFFSSYQNRFFLIGASRILLRFVNITLIMVVLSTLSRKNVV